MGTPWSKWWYRPLMDRAQSGPLQGVMHIDRRKLQRTSTLVILPYPELGERIYKVVTFEAAGDPQWVNLSDRDCERCYCRDFIWRCETESTVCKHVLACLLWEGHPEVVEIMAETKEMEPVAD